MGGGDFDMHRGSLCASWFSSDWGFRERMGMMRSKKLDEQKPAWRLLTKVSNINHAVDRPGGLPNTMADSIGHLQTANEGSVITWSRTFRFEPLISWFKRKSVSLKGSVRGHLYASVLNNRAF
jgi:hypothetical protein